MTPKSRPGPYVPLSTTFHTGRTGAAIQARYGAEGLGVWAAILASADRGLIVLRQPEDWLAIGLEQPASFSLQEFLTFLGHRKQTRKTRHGHVVYVELTRWEDWNKTKTRELARRRNTRYRDKSERHVTVTESVTEASRDHRAVRHPEAEADTEINPKAVDLLPTSEPEWPAEDEEQPWDMNLPELKEMPA